MNENREKEEAGKTVGESASSERGLGRDAEERSTGRAPVWMGPMDGLPDDKKIKLSDIPRPEETVGLNGLRGKRCSRCGETKDYSEFYRNRALKDGYMSRCKLCYEEYHQKTDPLKSGKMSRKMTLLNQSEVVKDIVRCFIEDPYRSVKSVANALGLSLNQVEWILNKNDYLRAVRFVATSKVKQLIPLAVKSFKESLESENPTVKLQSSMKLLESEQVMGPAKLDISVNNMSDLTIKQLQEIVDRAKVDPIEQVIEAEVVVEAGKA